MKPVVALVALFSFARAGFATEPSTLPPSPGVGGPLRRALTVAAVVLLAACGCGGDPTQPGPNTNGSICRAVERLCVTIV